MLKSSSKAKLVNKPVVDFYWYLGTIQNDLTPLMLRITEDSVKHKMICQLSYLDLFDWITLSDV